MNYYLKLFMIFFRVGAFTFGGGYAMVPIIQKEIVEKEGLIDSEDFLDIIAVAQSLPGAIAVNTSVFVGYKLVGMLGAAAALLGTVLPSLIVIIILAIFYNQIKDLASVQMFFQGVRPAIVALIFMSAIKLSKSIKKVYFNYAMMFFAFIGIIFLNIHPIFVIIGCAIAGLLHKRKEKEDGLS